MNTSSPYLRSPGLLAGTTLLLSCFLFSGCAYYAIRTPTLFGAHRDQFPAIVLSVDEHKYTFDWNTTTIGGVSVSKFVPNKKFWRLRVFQFSDGMRIGGPDMGYQPIADVKSVTLVDLPWDKLLRADLDLCDVQEQCKDTKAYSFTVLLHYE